MTEFGFIEQIIRLCDTLPTNGCEGIGDDCAVIPIGEGEALLMTQDMLIERVHFLRDAGSAYDLGCKSLAVNLSDVAAMGARPVASLLSLSIPEELAGEWIEEFMVGYRDLSREYGVALIGGDTTASKGDLAINITAVGRAPLTNIKRRSAAQVGDIIAVTGELGGSGAGLADILSGEFDTPFAKLHKRPTPRCVEGLWLGTQGSVRAMMDISDGVASDLRHILKASGVGAEVEISAVPRSTTIERALCSGEDYELLLTIAPDQFETLRSLFDSKFSTALTPIGRIVAQGGLAWLQDGAPLGEDFKGFSHY